MTSPFPVGNPLIELPVAGGLVAQLDKLLLDLGYSVWWAETMEFMILMIVLFAVTTAVFERLIPWLSDKLLGQAGLLTAPVPAVLLAPEWLVTKLMIRSGYTPGRIVFGYGDGVLLLTDGLEAGLTTVLRFFGAVGKYGRPIACLLIVFGFLSWNSSSCVRDSESCVSPAQHWSRQLATTPAGN
ncbi:hypothetical protein ACFU44_11770 [Nocardia rhizosphaerihabitans]|uniref:hypothetical protein n=1 Tax=Nocardia rhizosphaerihabitans TaxID=1691570 RepID=UPI00366C820B